MNRYRIKKTELGRFIVQREETGIFFKRWVSHCHEAFSNDCGWMCDPILFVTLDTAKKRVEAIQRGDIPWLITNRHDEQYYHL